MTFRWHSLLALVLSASTVFAGWDGFPCPSNVSWYSVETNHYISQLYTALVERCKASGVSAPAVVDTYANLFAGYTNTYTSTNGYIVTNNWICYTNVTVTNQFLPFAYSWSQTNGTSGTATCYPAIKQSWIAAWDDKFSSLLSAYWIDTDTTGILTNRSAITNWYATTNSHLHRYSRTNIFARFGIGSGTNGGGLFTHTPELLTNEWSLGSVRKTTNSPTSWTYQEMTPITTKIYDTSIRPVFEYWPSCPINQALAASFNGSSVVFTVTGTILNFSSQAATSGTEVVTITDSNDVVTVQPWYRITNITCSNAPPNSNDAWRVVYKNRFPIYGGNPYRIYACDIEERKKAIGPLVAIMYTKANPNISRSGSGTNIRSWDVSKSGAISSYDASIPAGSYLKIGTQATKFGTRTWAYIYGWCITNPIVQMPDAITNQTIESYRFIMLQSQAVSANSTYDDFGTVPSDLTNTNGYNFAGGGIYIGPVVYTGTIGSYDVNSITNPWAADPPPSDGDWYRGFSVPEWHMITIHTNWMTKW